MEERKFVQLKKNELAMKKYIWNTLGKGKVSSIKVEYTPVGEKIIISTDKPGLVIGARGARITELTEFLKKRFKLENPHIEIDEIQEVNFDAQLVADRIALDIEKRGNLKFKMIAYRELSRIMASGALGVELRLSGKLPSERAKSWRFAIGYLKKVGESAKEVNSAKAVALTKLGISGIKVKIMSPTARLYDKIDIDDAVKAGINFEEVIEEVVEKGKKKKAVKKKIAIALKEAEEEVGEEAVEKAEEEAGKEVKEEAVVEVKKKAGKEVKEKAVEEVKELKEKK